jgi:hypothetical protein
LNVALCATAAGDDRDYVVEFQPVACTASDALTAIASPHEKADSFRNRLALSAFELFHILERLDVPLQPFVVAFEAEDVMLDQQDRVFLSF